MVDPGNWNGWVMRANGIGCVLLLALGLTGCASSSYDDDDAPMAPPPRPQMMTGNLPTMSGISRIDSIAGQKPLQCVPYAREHSTIKIFGDAWTWWDQASGKYERGGSPAIGAVLVLHNYAGPQHGHVAVVKRVVSPREIRIDHANWLNDGSIYVNNPVMDVSAANDWSQVRVYNIQTGGWGARIYPVQGFIGSGSASAPPVPKPSAPRTPAPTPHSEDAPLDESLPDDEALIAQSEPEPAPRPVAALARPAPVRATALPPARAAGVMPVSASTSDFNPPAGSPFALTADDLTLP